MATITNLYTAPAAGPRSEYRRAVAAFQRPTEAPPVAYAANDVISDSTDTARAITFLNCGLSGSLQTATLGTTDTQAVDYELLVFSEEPTNFVDNTALALAAGDLRYLVGTFTFSQYSRRPLTASYSVTAYKADVGLLQTGSGLLLAQPSQPFVTVSGSLFGLLVARTIHTPLSATRYDIHLGIHTGRNS
jgi:hypothetical protein